MFSNFDTDAFIGNNFLQGKINSGIHFSLFYFPDVFSDSVVCGKVKKSYDVQVTSSDVGVMSLNIWVTSSNRRVTGSESQVTGR